MNFCDGVLALVLRGLDVEEGILAKAEYSVRRQVLSELAAQGELITRAKWVDGQPTKDPSHYEIPTGISDKDSNGVEGEWVLRFALGGGGGCLRRKDSEWAAKRQAERDAEKTKNPPSNGETTKRQRK